jgi:beta-phosphoglucomutase-like phosphatase (HAD superfamily)
MAASTVKLKAWKKMRRSSLRQSWSEAHRALGPAVDTAAGRDLHPARSQQHERAVGGQQHAKAELERAETDVRQQQGADGHADEPRG